MLTMSQVKRVVGVKGRDNIIGGVLNGLEEHGGSFGLDKPHRFIPFLAQTGHEADRFKTVREYHSGANYEGRKDLGNVYKGDGRKFRGRGIIQVTGRANTREFARWARKHYPNCPDFEKTPAEMERFPWAFLGAVWYWQSRNLNKYADRGDMEMLTRRINGGLNGYHDRLGLYVDFGLAYLGFSTVREFQACKGLVKDGVAGPQTRKAIHEALKGNPASVPKSDLKRSRTVAGAGTAGTVGAGMTVDAAIEAAGEVQHGLDQISVGTCVSVAIGLAVVIGAGLALYARWDDAGRPNLKEIFL